MPNDSSNPLLSLVRRVASRQGLSACTDGELLERFVASRDELAFRTIVDRHGALVWGVCFRILRKHQDAEDAFQATFVALSQKAAEGPRIGLLPAWLHEVARRAALNIRRASQRRREIAVESIPDIQGLQAELSPELAEVLDEEVGRLPERLREPFILCHLQKRTYQDAGTLLGCSPATICRRLEEGNTMLRERLGRRGLAPAGAAGVLASALPALAAVPPDVTARAVRVALAAGEASGLASAAAQTALRSMAGGKAKLIAAVASLTGLSVAGAVTAVVMFGASPSAQNPLPIRNPNGVKAAPQGPRDRLGDPLPAGAVARIGTLRFRAEGGSGDVAFLPGGQTIASVQGTGPVLIWDMATGRVAQQIDGPERSHWLAVSNDGRFLAAAGGTEVWAWNIAADMPEFLWKWTSNTMARSLTALAFSADGKVLAVGDPDDSCTRILDMATGDPVGILEGLATVQLAFSPDGKLLAGLKYPDGPVIDPRNARLILWDLTSGKALKTAGEPAASGFAFAPDSRSLAWSSPEGKVKVWNLAADRETAAWTATCPQPYLAYLPDGKTLAEFGSDRILFRDPAHGRESRPAVAAADLGIVSGIANYSGKHLSADGRFFATSVIGGQVAVWDMATGKEVGPEGRVHGTVATLNFSPNGQALTTLSGVHSIARTWDATTGAPGTCLALATGREAVAGAVGHDAEGRPFAFVLRSASEPFCLTSWDPKTGEVVSRKEIPVPRKGNEYPTIAASPDARWLAWCSEGVVTLADRATGREVRTLKPQHVTGRPIPLVFSADGETLVTLSREKRAAEVWDVETGRLRATMELPPDPRPLLPRHLAVSNDGRWLAVTARAGGGGQEVELWEVASGQVGQRFTCNVELHALAFSPDGRRLAGAAEDSSVRLWDLADGTAAEPLRGHRSRVVAVAFSPDGRRLGSGSLDGTGLIWDVNLKPAAPAGMNANAAELWAPITAKDIAAAHRASFLLAALSDDAVPVIANHLSPRRRKTDPTPATLVRGVAVLERISTPAARRVLDELSRQSADEPLAREAQAALRRLGPPAGPSGP